MRATTAGAPGPRSPRTEETGLTFLRAAGRLYHEVEEALEPIGLTYRDYRALERLGAAPPGAAAALARREAVADPSDAAAVERLERAGLVRCLVEGRAHAVRVEPTAAGAARAREAGERLEALVARFASRLEAGERAGMERLLARLGRVRRITLHRSELV